MFASRSAWVAGICGGLVVLVVGGLIVHLTRTAGSSTKLAPKASVKAPRALGSQRPRYGEFNLGIAYGTAPKQVLRELGSPSRKQGNCWVYRGRVGSIRGRYSGSFFVDAKRFCFSEGPAGGRAVTQVFDHYAKHTIVKRDPVTHKITSKKTYPAEWGFPLRIEEVPSWYLQQNS